MPNVPKDPKKGTDENLVFSEPDKQKPPTPSTGDLDTYGYEFLPRSEFPGGIPDKNKMFIELRNREIICCFMHKRTMHVENAISAEELMVEKFDMPDTLDLDDLNLKKAIIGALIRKGDITTEKVVGPWVPSDKKKNNNDPMCFYKDVTEDPNHRKEPPLVFQRYHSELKKHFVQNFSEYEWEIEPLQKKGFLGLDIIKKQEAPKGYELALISDLHDDQKPEQNKLYVQLVDGAIQYTVLDPDGEIIKGRISNSDLDLSNLGSLESELSNAAFKKRLLDITSKQGHTHQKESKISGCRFAVDEKKQQVSFSPLNNDEDSKRASIEAAAAYAESMKDSIPVVFELDAISKEKAVSFLLSSQTPDILNKITKINIIGGETIKDDALKELMKNVETEIANKQSSKPSSPSRR